MTYEICDGRVSRNQISETSEHLYLWRFCKKNYQHYIYRNVLNIDFLFINTIFDKDISSMYMSQVSCAGFSSVTFRTYLTFIILKKKRSVVFNILVPLKSQLARHSMANTHSPLPVLLQWKFCAQFLLQ